MGLLDAKKKAQARQAPKGALGKIKNRDNGAVPKGALGALAKKKRGGALAKIKQQRLLSSKDDFRLNGLAFHNAHVQGTTTSGRPFGVVDVSTGDVTVTFHNRHGSWLTDVPGKTGYMREPASFEIKSNLQGRFDRELKARGIPTATEKREIEAQKAAEQRKRLAKLEADREAKKDKKTDKTKKTTKGKKK